MSDAYPFGEDVWRDLAPHALARLVRTYGASQFDVCEEAVQDALLEAATTWRAQPPDDPRAWLVTAARRRFVDRVRSDQRRRRREQRTYALDLAPTEVTVADDSLLLLQLSCDPDLPRPAQIALTLRAVCGLSTTQIANLYQVPEATIAQRIVRAKRTLRHKSGPFTQPADRTDRLDVVREVIYLMLTEAHHTTTGAPVHDHPLTREARRLAELVHAAVPEDTEAAGLLAMALFTEARAAARLGPEGELIPLDEQDRSRWDHHQVDRGLAILDHAVPGATPGPYLLQACIAAVHMQAASPEDTDWNEILALYTLLEAITPAPNPNIAVNRAVAVGAVHGPRAGLGILDAIETSHPDTPRLWAVKAHLFEQDHQLQAAQDAYRHAIAASRNLAEQRHLQRRLRLLTAER